MTNSLKSVKPNQLTLMPGDAHGHEYILDGKVEADELVICKEHSILLVLSREVFEEYKSNKTIFVVSKKCTRAVLES